MRFKNLCLTPLFIISLIMTSFFISACDNAKKHESNNDINNGDIHISSIIEDKSFILKTLNIDIYKLSNGLRIALCENTAWPNITYAKFIKNINGENYSGTSDLTYLNKNGDIKNFLAKQLAMYSNMDPENSFFVFTGSINSKKIISLAEQSFGTLPVVKQKSQIAIINQTSEIIKKTWSDVKEVKIQVKYAMPELSVAEEASFELFRILLKEDPNSVYSQMLNQKNYRNDIFIFNIIADYWSLELETTMLSTGTWMNFIPDLDTAIKTTLETELTKQNLDRAKLYYKIHMQEALEQPEALSLQVSLLIKNHKNLEHINDLYYQIMNTNEEQIQTTIKKYLVPQRRTITYFYPKVL